MKSRSTIVAVTLLAALVLGGVSTGLWWWHDSRGFRNQLITDRRLTLHAEIIHRLSQETGRLPTEDEWKEVAVWNGEVLPRVDAWGNRLVYLTRDCHDEEPQFLLASFGRDGQPDRAELSSYFDAKRRHNEYDSDVDLVNVSRRRVVFAGK